MPAPNKGQFTRGDPRINKQGRPKVGLTLAEKVRAVVGEDGQRLVDMWAALAYGRLPADDQTSSRAIYLASLRSLMAHADTSDRIACSRLLAERGFGKPKEETTVTGSMVLTWET